MTFAKEHRVAILMATYQGERYISDQLDSFERQTYDNWQLIVSDDGSTDKTLDMVHDFASRNPAKVNIVNGPRQGFVSNFLSLLFRDDIEADYFSFSDQDDIWFDDKLERAVAWLKEIPSDKPALYCSRTHLVNNDKESLGNSPLFRRLPSFSNALVQNIGGGNTMVMNKAARDLIKQAGLVNVVSHDWWIYILISGANGAIHYDSEPTLAYRQHGENLIGTNLGYRARLLRLKKIIQGQYRNWNALHIRELDKNRALLTAENQEKFTWFKAIHNKCILTRVYYFLKLGVYRQNTVDTLAVFISALLKKV
ncbi:glycosyltransferase family 2 protein [Yokenella regensburgei]|uniref:glycosyltransferase family 2 protein n=1 Tax=Yokenella regensburgei TaxID=158877 RepID=UPI003F13BEA9